MSKLTAEQQRLKDLQAAEALIQGYDEKCDAEKVGKLNYERNIGGTSRSVGAEYTLVGTADLIVSTSGNRKFAYVGCHVQGGGTPISVNQLIGPSSTVGLMFTGKAANESDENGQKTSVDVVASCVKDAKNLYKPLQARTIKDFLASYVVTGKLKGAKVRYLGTAIRPFIARDDSGADITWTTYKKGYKRAQTVALWTIELVR